MQKLVRGLKRVNDALMSVERTIMGVCLVLILVLFFLTIIARMVFDSDVPGMEEIVMTMAVWLYCVGAALACYTDTHVSADLIKTMMKTKRAKAIHRLYIFAFNIFISGYFTVLSLEWLSFQAALKPVTAIWRYSLMIPYSSTLFGFIFCDIYFVMHFIKALYVLVTGNPVAEIPDTTTETQA